MWRVINIHFLNASLICVRWPYKWLRRHSFGFRAHFDSITTESVGLVTCQVLWLPSPDMGLHLWLECQDSWLKELVWQLPKTNSRILVNNPLPAVSWSIHALLLLYTIDRQHYFPVGWGTSLQSSTCFKMHICGPQSLWSPKLCSLEITTGGSSLSVHFYRLAREL